MKLRDGEFIDLVNHVRIAELNDRDVTLLKSKFVDSNDDYQKLHFIYLQKIHHQTFTKLLCQNPLAINFKVCRL